ncbi:MAG TPA: hypothetical protein VEW05_14455 [Candidatus Polarisedimenticolia bacterium]|nr:hypothetical protein [Candidatus Polarisedimenticolia bacterium]
MIEALPTNGTDDALYIGSLPRRTWCRQNFADAQVSHLFLELMAEDRIAVAQQVAGRFGKGKGLPQLLDYPSRGWVGGRIEVENAALVMGQNEKHLKNLETDRGHGEKIDGHQLLDMILEEGAPSLRRGFMAGHHVFADAALSDVDAKFEQFAMDAGCTPAGILPAHLADQMPDLMRNEGSSGFSAAHLPGPEQAETSAMPRYDRFRPDDGQR